MSWRDAIARWSGGAARPDENVAAALKEIAAQVFELRVQLATQDKAVASSQRIRADMAKQDRYRRDGWVDG